MLERSKNKIALITIFHTGAYSLCEAFRRAGCSVVPKGGIGVERKLGEINNFIDSDVIWVHWSWVFKAPTGLLFDREVITVLRDPVECMISAAIRNTKPKAVQQAEQWLNLYRFRDQVDQWIDFRELAKLQIGTKKMPHLNATGEDRRKDWYKEAIAENLKGTEKPFKELAKTLEPQWQCLMVVRREIRDIFEFAGMSDILKGTPCNDE